MSSIAAKIIGNNYMFKWVSSNKYFFWIALLLILWIRGFIFLDPDFGWRLKSGEIILNHGIPKTDPFTYTMPSYSWINHAWLVDTSIASLYPLIGSLGLSAIYALAVVGAIYISYKLALDLFPVEKKETGSKKVKVWHLVFPILLMVSAAFYRFAGVRAQVWTWLFMAIVFRVLLVKKFWLKYRLFLPLLFLLWVNIHGGFAAGLATLTFVIFVKSVKERRIDPLDILVVALSVLFTFVNPYGGQIYREVWLTITDKEDHSQILEWNSYFKSFDIPSLVLIALSLILIYIGRKKFLAEELLIYFVFLFQAVSAVRQIPIWVLIALPLTFKALAGFYREFVNTKVARQRFKEVYGFFSLIAILVFVVQCYLAIAGAFYFSEKKYYPQGAINFLKNEKLPGNLFSKYEWGGYIIWKYPEKEVFIDGRMPFWKWDANIPNETNIAMKDYLNITSGEKDYTDFFHKYEVETFLWTPSKKPDPFMELDKKLGDQLNIVYKLLGIKRRSFSLTNELEEDGWQKIYFDEVSVIYQKPR